MSEDLGAKSGNIHDKEGSCTKYCHCVKDTRVI